MKTIIIPVDFSPASNNALQYITGLAKDIKIDKIILLKNFYKSVYEQLLPSPDFFQISEQDILEERNLIQDQLNLLQKDLVLKCDPSINIETRISDLPLLRAIHELIVKEQPHLIILGSDSLNHLNESYLGARVIEITKTSPVPVLVIPADSQYKKAERVVLPCDFTAVSRFQSLNSISATLNLLQPELLVLNVDPKQKHLTHEEEHTDSLKEVLGGYQYKVYYTEDRDTVTGILNFAESKDAQLVIALPGRYSFFYNLTHNSITNALALNTHQPILILK